MSTEPIAPASAPAAGDQVDAEPAVEDQDGGQPLEVSVNAEFPKRRIVLQVGEQSVEVEGPDDLDELSRLASHLWVLTTPPRTAPAGFGGGSTLVTQIAAHDTETEDQA